ncbi:MAG: hypothetical protein H7210_01720 [Pyrinomonadaceae bacterium]|nr:hypothetical protein [Phycisphaerales bacterium]
MRQVFASCGVVLACVGSVFAQPANDSCGSPESITGFGVTPFTNIDATTDGVDNGACTFFGVTSVFNDVWYCWTAGSSEPTKIRLCGASYDTKLAVYDGCSCPEGSGILACNDDSCSLQSEITFSPVAGQQYLIRVGSYAVGGFGSGNVELVSALPAILGGPITSPFNGHDYYILESSSWSAAEARAVALGGHLATVRNADENEWLRSTLGNFKGQDRRLWIGFNDVASEGSFAWTSGENPGFTNWSGGEPNDSGGLEDATEMFGSNGLWNDNRDVPSGVIVYGVVEISGPPPCQADFNTDGFVNSQDFFDFLVAFFASSPNADFNSDGFINSQDFFDFLAAFFTGC